MVNDLFNYLKILSIYTLALFAFIFWKGDSVQASDFQSPRTAALGGAGHASPLLSDAIYLNPSFTSYMLVHALSVNYLTYGGGTVSTPAGPMNYYGHILNASVIDGTAESLFQAGVGYTRREDASFIHIGASKNIISRLGVGLGAKYIMPNDNSGNRYFDGTFSMSGIATNWFQTALIVDNLTQSAVSRGFYREFTLGTKFNVMSIVLLYLDPHWAPTVPSPQSAWGYEAGAEFPFFSDFFLRLGMFKSAALPQEAQQRGDGYGLGVGWLAPRLSLDYSFSRVLTPISTLAHNFGATVYF